MLVLFIPFITDVNKYEALTDYIIDKIRCFETAEEKYISPVLNCIESGESIFKTAYRSRALRRLELLEKEIDAIGNYSPLVSEGRGRAAGGGVMEG